MVAGLEQTRPRCGDFIRLLRVKQNLSGRALGPKAGLSTGYVSKVEGSQLDPSLTCFSRLAVALNMTPFEVWVIVRTEAAASTGVPVTGDSYSGSSQLEEISCSSDSQ